MKYLKIALQIVFYALVLALIVSRSMAAVISHDENQFVAAAQVLVHHGLLPYLSYPYTHMPYVIAFYAVAVALTPYDFLAARLLSSLVWLASMLVIVLLARTIRDRDLASSSGTSSFPELLWEFSLVVVFLYHPLAAYVLGAAVNHSFATLFGLLSLLFFVRATRPGAFSNREPFWCGIFVSLATFTRFNYASLIVVLLILWLLHSLVFHASRLLPALARFVLGIIAAALPALVLLIAAPAGFYYSNLVYIRLNTIYYEGLLTRTGMDLPSKFLGFFGGILHRPVDWIMYAALVVLAILSLFRVIRRRSLLDLGLFATAGFCFVLWLTGFAPTPGLTQYFFAPLPFLLVLLAWILPELGRSAQRLYLPAALALFLALFFSVRIPNPMSSLAVLTEPSSWTPVEVHDFALSLRQYVPGGRILTLMPMVPLEAGYDTYPFETTGAFNWRTSFLLTPERRLRYGVVSPDELPAILAADPPAAILTGFETPNAGFEFGDQGGLETPFNDYAVQNSYQRFELMPAFLEHPLVLWVRP